MYKTLREIYTTGPQDIYLYIVYLLSIILGIYIIIAKNPVISVLFLIGLFCSISLYLIIIGLSFIGFSYLLVYVGAISILFLFILMLINIRISELLTNNNNSIPLALLSVICFNYTVDDASFNGVVGVNNNSAYLLTRNIEANYSDETTHLVNKSEQIIMNIWNKSWTTWIVSNTHITSIGNILYTNLFVYFVIVSIILLLAMVGAIIITIYRPIRDDKLK